MTKFKVGDTVKLVEDFWGLKQNEEVNIVEAPRPNDDGLYVIKRSNGRTLHALEYRLKGSSSSACPAHYNQGDIECIDAIKVALGSNGAEKYALGNVLKYVWRCEHKDNKLWDLQKAQYYLNTAIELVNEEST